VAPAPDGGVTSMRLLRDENGTVRYDRLFLALLAALTFLMLATFRDYGYSWDETWQNRWYGQAVIRFIMSLGEDLSATDTNNFYLYGGTFDAAAELLVKVSPLEPRNSRHLANALAGLTGIAGCWALARRLGGAAAGWWAALFLAACAPWYGHLFINAKDIPFAAGYIWSLYLLWGVIEEFPRASLRTSLLLGVAIGLTLGVRIGGVLVLLYLFLAALVYLGDGIWRRQEGQAWLCNQGKPLAITAMTVTVVAWLLMLACWPAALLRPLAIPLEAFRAASHFQWIGTLLWNGREVWSNDLPWNYLLVIYAVQLPEILTLLFGVALVWGCFRCFRYRQSGQPAGIALLLLATLFPVIWAIVTGATIYDNGRQFLFVLPPLACLAALYWTALLTRTDKVRRGLGLLLGVVMCCGLATAGVRMAQLHPYEYTFLNLFAGGIPSGARRFDTDYWITSYREASFAVVRHARTVATAMGKSFPTMQFSVAVVGPPESIAEDLPNNFVLTAYQPDILTDYLVATTRWNSDRYWPDWLQIAEVGRGGMRFAVVKASPELARLVPPAMPKQ
jgi:hypothetical protein